MIFVDYRSGSAELAEPLQRKGLDVEITTLEFGDVAFEGRGEKGAPVTIGIEFKKLRELIQALRTQRLQGYQAVGMRPMFDFSYLFVEGELIYDRRGTLQRRKSSGRVVEMEGAMNVSEMFKRIFVLHLRGGMNPLFLSNRKDTIQAITDLYRTWTDQDLDKHKSHIAIYNPPSIIPISKERHTFCTFPHIGRKASAAVDEHFNGDIGKATNASVDEWAAIQVVDDKGRGRRLGLKVAQDIVNYCRKASNGRK